ncbi:MAG: aminotransferase class I/II-fold pyridoxal phosphate-dependent enzyme, partial [Hyphomicrobiales bacterium]|nr:aminotransferase class I/II-fold pyridoxal phosphate-dependent enzyme [Hyphomicrobiales bacterium]
GARVETPRDLDGLRGADLAVVVNPNNPDGALRDAAALRALARDVGLLLVDEAFVDFLPAGASLAGAVPDNAVVLRSFGKAHGLAGLRLAFAICAPVRAAALRAEIGPWPVSGLAIAIGVTALADRDWRDRARRLALAGAERLDRLLTRSGLIARGAAPLFRYLETPRAAALHRALAEAGIWTRAFAGRPDALRIGLPFGAAAWSRLERALTAFEG